MKRFRFRLHAVLAVRRRIEETRAADLARHVRACAAVAARVRTLDEAMAVTRDAIVSVAAHGVSGEQLQELASRTEATWRARTREHAALQEAIRAEEASRTQLVEAARARQALEQLEDRERRRHADAARRTEQGVLDDSAGVYAARRDRAERGTR